MSNIEMITYLARSICYTLWLILLQGLLVSHGIAQTSATDTRTPAGLTPGSPAGSYALSGFDNINLYTGGLSFHLPLLQVGGRGGASYTMTLPIEQKWRVNHDFANQGQHWPNHNWWTGLRPGYGPGVLQGRQTHEGCGDGGPSPGGEVQTGSMTTLTFSAPDGTEYELRDELTGGNRLISTCCCHYQQHANGASRGTVFKTFDGTAATFVSDTTIHDWSGSIESGPHIIEPTGHLILRDGTRYRIEWGKVIWIRDRNGNRLDFEYNSPYGMTRVTDSLGRQVNVEYDINDPQYGLCDRISFNGVGGAPRKIWVTKTTLGNALRTTQPYDITTPQTYAQLFIYLTGSSTTLHNPVGTVSSVWLPNGRRYQILYNTYSELARVVLPTGGAIEYDWIDGGGGTMCSQGPEVRRSVSERRVYRDGSTLESKVTYGEGVVISRNASGTPIARSKHYFNGGAFPEPCPSALSHSQWNEGKEYQTEEYTADGVTLLRRINQTWQQTAPGWHSSIWSAEASNDPKLVTTVTTIEPNGSNLVTKQTAINPQTGAIGFDQFNNQTDLWEYDYGTGAPSTHPKRHTNTEYLTTNPVNSINYTGTNVHIRGLPSAQKVYSVNDSTGAETLVAQSETKYDETALFPWYGTVQSWVDPGMARGNPTKVRRWLNPGNSWLETRAQFDQVGNVSGSWDAKNNQTEITYSATGNFAYPTQTTSAVPDPTGQYGSATALLTTSAYDFSTGLVTSTTDANGQINYILYVDLLDRPTQVIRAAGTSAQNQTTFGYNDVDRIITTTSDLNAFNDNLLKSQTVYDGLGRTTETRQYEGGTNFIAVRQVPFVVLQDGANWLMASQTSNPFRPHLGEQPVWTTSFSDALSRVIKLKTPDNSLVTTSYMGNTVTVTDQIGKKRKSVTDALGRLKEVYEDPTGLNYLTSYSYDTLDNLTRVSQGTQSRYFMYDSLKRLIRARNPEQDVHASLNLADPLTGNTQWSFGYQYDSNGNLAQKTDARGVRTDYSYDGLNRNVSVIYLDGTPPIYLDRTPPISRVYDGAVNGKGRFWYHVSGNLEHTAIDTYDALGRVKNWRQHFWVNNNWSQGYYMSRNYDLAGNVTLQRYPSERTASYAYDDAGRTSSFSGDLGGDPRTYATGIVYSPFGGMAKEQFGTDTPLYNKSLYNSRGQLGEIRVGTTYTGPGDSSWNRGAIINNYSCWGACSGPDNNGNLKRQEHWIPKEDQPQPTTFEIATQVYAYDNLNRLQSVEESSMLRQGYVYDRYGNRSIDQTYTVGLGINKKDFTVNTANNRLGVPGGQTGIMSYDSAGNLTTDTYSGAGSRTFDAENRMTEAWGGNNQQQFYTYNADGQRVRRKVDGVETWQIYGIDGELMAEYPANGATASPQKEYGYRNGQLLIEVTLGAGWGPAPIFYDPQLVVGETTVQSRHITELRSAINDLRGHWGISAFSWQTPAGQGDWIKADPILEMRTALDQALGAPSPSYSADLGQFLPIRATHIQELRNRVLGTWSSGSSLKINWLVADQLGTPRMIFDKTGSLANVKRHDYLPFGEELYAGQGVRTTALGYAGDTVRQKFTLKERDNETELDYFLARYYSSKQGRFTSPDEFTGGPDELYDFVDDAADNPTFYADLTNPQSINKYQYVLNNPLRYTDDDGHCGPCVAQVLRWGARTPIGRRVITKAGSAATTAIVAASGAAKSYWELLKKYPPNAGDMIGPSADSFQYFSRRKPDSSASQQGQSQPQGQQEGQSTNYQPNPKHDGPKGDDRRGVSAQPEAGGSLYDSAIQVKPGQRVAVDQSSGKFVVYRTDPNGQTHGYQTTWQGLRNDQRAALQKADLVTKRGKIRPPTEGQQ